LLHFFDRQPGLKTGELYHLGGPALLVVCSLHPPGVRGIGSPYVGARKITSILCSTEEKLKASVSNEGRINVLLWYCLVDAYVRLPLGVEGSPGGKWLCVVRGRRSPPSWHPLVAGGYASEQVRLMKTVKVQ